VVLEASRVAVGQQNNYGFEVHGTRGAVFWDFRRMGELGVSTGNQYQDQAVSTVFVGPAHGEFAAFQPGAATAMSFDDLKVIEPTTSCGRWPRAGRTAPRWTTPCAAPGCWTR